MAHLLLSLVFLALLVGGFRSIWHDLTRPLVMQPWEEEAMLLAPAPERIAATPAFAAPARPVALAPTRHGSVGGIALAA